MAVEIVDKDLLVNFSPFKFMSDKSLEEVVRKAKLVTYPRDRMLFKRGEPRENCHWLVEGSLDLVDDNYETQEMVAGYPSATHMLEENNVYHRTAVVVDKCTLIEINPDECDLILTVDQNSEPATPDLTDWMSELLRSHLFELIPPANIQALFDKFSMVNYSKGTKVVRQGEQGDYFYVVKEGTLSIDRIINKKVKHLKTIGPGAFFGEDALVRELPRNATITMLSTGVLMRLAKEDFNSLMVKPASAYVTQDEVDEVIDKGEQKITLIDVRHPKEIESSLPPGTINIPLQILREYASKLEPETLYVVTTPGRRSELAAFLLNQAGYDTFIFRH